ncbi:hypothetical protein [Nocardia sp. NPDC004711]
MLSLNAGSFEGLSQTASAAATGPRGDERTTPFVVRTSRRVDVLLQPLQHLLVGQPDRMPMPLPWGMNDANREIQDIPGKFAAHFGKADLPVLF